MFEEINHYKTVDNRYSTSPAISIKLRTNSFNIQLILLPTYHQHISITNILLEHSNFIPKNKKSRRPASLKSLKGTANASNVATNGNYNLQQIR